MSQPTILRHPLVSHHLPPLRDRDSSSALFRATVRRLSTLLAYEATADLHLRNVKVATPLSICQGQRLAARVSLVPILRAGLGMVDAVLDLMPDAEVRHLGFYRDEQTLQPVEYYKKLADGRAPDVALILDPMLATGGSAVAAVRALREWGVPDVRLLAIIAAPEGIQRMATECPDVRIFVCAVDERLNDKGYILPGLGDAGDRVFNTVV